MSNLIQADLQNVGFAFKKTAKVVDDTIWWDGVKKQAWSVGFGLLLIGVFLRIYYLI